MPVSAETAARADHEIHTPIIDQHAYVADDSFNQPPPANILPSETAPPTIVNEAPQQAATDPQAGSTVQEAPGPYQPSFKEKVIGYAKEIRGSTLRNPETKEEGQRILQGQEKFDIKKVGPKSHAAREGLT
ncbi:hypothetical protein ABKN59_008465 [Abortiporus biennis]